ncbi:uncharacterized protein LOC133919153 isoform X2 [Phragmites australis]|uniref:uncharacterized protein LOC133919153 isoform X2 n=1 Tax=Phragmites australis TaxID=29695 RepID=UPI002D7A0D89|nr:uncharacterized protein LOC133919153 isoform X2 [Phragmites australis]
MEHDVHHHEAMELPPGFRFHPTDEELITHYLARKAADPRFAARAVGEADLNNSGDDGGEGVVLLLREGSQVPDGTEDEPGHGVRLLEGDGQGQGDLQGQGPRRHEEDARLLHGEGTQGRQDRLGHARVPPRGQARHDRRQQQQPPLDQGCHIQGRVGAVQGVQEERRAAVSGRRQEIRGVHGDGGRRDVVHVHGERPRRVRAASADGCVRQRHRHVTVSGGGVHRASAAGKRDLLLQRAGGPVPEPTLPPLLRPRGCERGTGHRRRGRGPPHHGLSLAFPGEPADAVRRRGGRHGARIPAGGRRVVQQAG